MSQRSHEDALAISVGDGLILQDGSVVVVEENPLDGVWLFCRYLSGPDAGLVGRNDQPVYVSDVRGFVPELPVDPTS